MTKIFSMDEQLEERKRVIFPKRLFFVVLGLAAFVSLGAFVFPHAAHAQEGCVWACDMGSDVLNEPIVNSPQPQLDVAACVDPSCVIQNLTPIIGFIPSANTDVGLSPTQNLACTNGGNTDVTISGPVVAWLRDTNGAVILGSPAQALLSITIKCATLNGLGSGSSTITRAVVAKELRTNVFDASSSITILPSSPTPSLNSPTGWTGCPTDNKGHLNGNCAFPLGIVEFNNNNAIANALPPAGFFAQGEVFRAQESNRFVGIRDCKGNPNGLPSTIVCASGQILTGGNSLALLNLKGNWSGAAAHTFNPKSGSNPFDISTIDPTDLSGPPLIIDPASVVASANGGNPVFPTGCNNIPSQNVERCFFNARDFNVVCKTGDQVNLLVTGATEDGRKFESTDNPVCSNK